jgi:predicted CoA-binding protein
MSAREVIAAVLIRNGGHISGNEDKILAALDAAPEAMRLELARWLAGEAWRVVPVEPTEAVKEAGVNAMASLEYIAANEHEVQHIYRAMLAAAKEAGDA